jgi:hypothetical protein
MHRLVIVSGPNRGSAFQLVEGENLIGRQMDNHIVLSSSRVSKRHCSILVGNGGVFLKDDSSTNGTFVNGALTRQQTLKSGDKLGVGEFVLEFVKAREARASVPAPLQAVPVAAPAGAFGQDVSMAREEFQLPVNEVEDPEDLPSKIRVLFEGKLMPAFYSLLMKSGYRTTTSVVLAVAGAAAILGAALPMQDLADQSVRREASIRARVLAREVADRFQPDFANHTESRIDFTFLENEDSIRSVAITDPSLRIIAPVSRQNQMFAGSYEAVFALEMAKRFRDGQESGAGRMDFEKNIAVYVEPIKVPGQVKSPIVAMVTVAVDFSGNMITAGGAAVAFGTGIAIGGSALLLAFLILMRLSFKPYEVLNEDLDQVLRGEIPRVTEDFKIEETKGLWDNINVAAQRLPKTASDHANDEGAVNWESRFEGFRSMADQGGFAFAGFDPNLGFAAMNELFTEVSGIRPDSMGQAVSVAGDQAISALLVDLMKMTMQSQSKSTTDRFAFGGDDYDVTAIAVQVKEQTGLAVLFKRKG